MPRPTDARDRTLETAARLFRRQGYHGTPVSQILEESGAPRGSLYFHFPGGKEEIATEAVAVASAEMEALIDWALERSTTPIELVGRILGGLARWLEGSGYYEGCPIATVTLELVPTSESVAAAVRGAFDLWVDRVAAGLESLGLPAERARSIAMLTVTTAEGGLLLSRAQGSTAALRLVRQEVIAMVEAEPRPG